MRKLPETEVLIFTGADSEEVVRNVFGAGARSYLLKTEANNHLAPAIEALCKHRTYFSSKVADMIFAGYPKGSAGVEDLSLTARERELVQLMAEGKSKQGNGGNSRYRCIDGGNPSGFGDPKAQTRIHRGSRALRGPKRHHFGIGAAGSPHSLDAKQALQVPCPGGNRGAELHSRPPSCGCASS